MHEDGYEGMRTHERCIAVVGVRSLIGSYDSGERETSKMVIGEIMRYVWMSNQSIILMRRGDLQIET